MQRFAYVDCVRGGFGGDGVHRGSSAVAEGGVVVFERSDRDHLQRDSAVRDGGFTPRWVRLEARGTVARVGSEVFLVLPSDQRLQIAPGAKREALLAGPGASKQQVVVEGNAATQEGVTRVTVDSFRIL